MNVRTFRAFFVVLLGGIAAVALAACGGSSSTGGPPNCGICGGIGPGVSGDMLAYQANHGWNYHGNALGSSSVTLSVYADPPQNGTDVLVLFGVQGSVADAFGGTKLAALGLQTSDVGYNVTQYLLLNANGSVYAQGPVSGPSTLVLQLLVQDGVFGRTYPGMVATVQFVGAVPGASACPTPAKGATVRYTFMGGTYLVSYVPGCGITQYIGNHGETLTLASVGNYPQLGTQSTRRMSTLSVLDTVESLGRILATRQKWSPFPSP
jgi:hypothetical protein